MLDNCRTHTERNSPGECWAQYDAQGIFLCFVCDKCEKEKLSKYRPEILTGYTQADVDEPIWEEPDVGGPYDW